jgi:hypothetical protein
MLRAEKAVVESYEHFPKQTYRNRCSIYSPNGLQHLVIPLDGRKDKTLTKDIRISYDRNWQLIHWRSLEAAYRSSPFFEFYEDELKPFYEKRTELLIEFNFALQKKIMELLDVKKEISFTSQYEKMPAGLADHRSIFSKKNIPSKSFPRYLQVFENKHGFIPDLSIADLLFNLGPKAKDHLLELNS